MHILHWVLLAVCRTVLVLPLLQRADLLYLISHKSWGLGGVAAASSCYTAVCMLYDTYRVPAQSESILVLFMHVTTLAACRTVGAAAAAAYFCG